jgi:DNA-binding cell septation regulator SpoVG
MSTWPQKNSEEDIDLFLSMISTAAGQKEFYNNPVSEGDVFKEITYGKVPPLSKFKFLVVYGDPAPGENKTKGSSTKAVSLLGKTGGRLYVIKVRIDRCLNAEFIEWYIEMLEYVNGKVPVYCWMENNRLQDPFFQQVFKPIARRVSRKKNIVLHIREDKERKTDKATRIDASLEPLNREGNLILNEAEKDNPHMKRLEEQFKLFTLRLAYPSDGPDCVEGGNRRIDLKQREVEPEKIISRRQLRSNNKNRL